jgi:hypothetical protein
MTIRLEEGSKFWHYGRLLDIEAANGNYDQWQQRSTDFVRDASKMFRRRQKSGCAFSLAIRALPMRNNRFCVPIIDACHWATGLHASAHQRTASSEPQKGREVIISPASVLVAQSNQQLLASAMACTKASERLRTRHSGSGPLHRPSARVTRTAGGVLAAGLGFEGRGRRRSRTFAHAARTARCERRGRYGWGMHLICDLVSWSQWMERLKQAQSFVSCGETVA